MTNLEWIQSGKTGCVFATLFSKNPALVGWKTVNHWDWMCSEDKFSDSNLICIEFNEKWSKDTVRAWALEMEDFYLEDTSDKTEGLRRDCKGGKAWVQYFGPDSHVKTRQSPIPMLMWCNKMNTSYYIKVGFKGVFHLAHAWTNKYTSKIYDLLWQQSHKQTKKIIGHDLTIIEAAKTTFLK